MRPLLLETIGAVKPADLQAAAADPAVTQALTEAAVAFVRAGGVVTLTEYAALLPAERGALLAARRAYDAETAFRFGVATQGALGAALALEPADGGEMRDAVTLEAAVAGAVERARGAPPMRPGGGAP